MCISCGKRNLFLRRIRSVYAELQTFQNELHQLDELNDHYVYTPSQEDLECIACERRLWLIAKIRISESRISHLKQQLDCIHKEDELTVSQNQITSMESALRPSTNDRCCQTDQSSDQSDLPPNPTTPIKPRRRGLRAKNLTDYLNRRFVYNSDDSQDQNT